MAMPQLHPAMSAPPLTCCRVDDGSPFITLYHRESGIIRGAHERCVMEKWAWRPQMVKWQVLQYAIDLSTWFMRMGGERWPDSPKH